VLCLNIQVQNKIKEFNNYFNQLLINLINKMIIINHQLKKEMQHNLRKVESKRKARVAELILNKK
jgi:hypothetical protein